MYAIRSYYDGHISRKMGSYEVYIDDNFVEKVDCYFGADLYNMIIYQTDVLSAGLHKLELRNNFV